MRLVLISFLLLYLIISKANSDITNEVVKTLEKSNNYTFKFIQKTLSRYIQYLKILCWEIYGLNLFMQLTN